MHAHAGLCAMSFCGGDIKVKECFGEDLLAQDRFIILGDVGGGAYGTVYKARDRANGGEIVALKKITVQEDPDVPGYPPFVMREVANLNRLSSAPEKHIVRLLDVLCSKGRYEHELIVCMVFEYMEQDLDNFIHQSRLDHKLTKVFLGQILKGVDWMHMNNIVHRDLKPQNILVTNDGTKVKIADFGLSRVIGSNIVLSTQVVTQWYRAPEVLLHSSYNKPVDIWSVGCIFAEMMSGGPLFAAEKKGEKAQLEKVFSIIGTPPQDLWPGESSISANQFAVYKPVPWMELLKEADHQALDLLSKMLKFGADQRITAHLALCHYYVAHLDCDNCQSTSSNLSFSVTLNSFSDSSIHDSQ